MQSISSTVQQALETDRQNANCRRGAGVVSARSNSVTALNEGPSQPILSSTPGCDPLMFVPRQKCRKDLHISRLYSTNLHCYDPASLARELLNKEQ